MYHYKLGDDNESDSDATETPGEDNNQIMSDLMSSASDFCPVGPTPAIMFGLREVTLILMMIMIMMMLTRSLCSVRTH